jgi:hypothetical protein
MPDCWIFLLKRRRALSNVSFSPTRTSANPGSPPPARVSHLGGRPIRPLGAAGGRGSPTTSDASSASPPEPFVHGPNGGALPHQVAEPGEHSRASQHGQSRRNAHRGRPSRASRSPGKDLDERLRVRRSKSSRVKRPPGSRRRSAEDDVECATLDTTGRAGSNPPRERRTARFTGRYAGLYHR